MYYINNFSKMNQPTLSQSLTLQDQSLTNTISVGDDCLVQYDGNRYPGMFILLYENRIFKKVSS